MAKAHKGTRDDHAVLQASSAVLHHCLAEQGKLSQELAELRKENAEQRETLEKLRPAVVPPLEDEGPEAEPEADWKG